MQEGETRSGFHRRLTPLADADNLIEYALGHFPLRGLRDFDDLVVSNDGHFIAIGIEADAFAGDVVDHDGVELLGCELLAGVFQSILSFCGETDDDLRLLAERNFLEDVRGRFELKRERTFAFDLLRRRRLRGGNRRRPRS
jgi:hypothetical protein